MYDNGVKLAQLAQSDATEKKIMVMLANKTAEDSRTMRIATIVAMFYLPANLVMVGLRFSNIPVLISHKARVC